MRTHRSGLQPIPAARCDAVEASIQSSRIRTPQRTGDTMIFSPIQAVPAVSIKVRIGRFAKEIADLGFR